MFVHVYVMCLYWISRKVYFLKRFEKIFESCVLGALVLKPLFIILASPSSYKSSLREDSTDIFVCKYNQNMIIQSVLTEQKLHNLLFHNSSFSILLINFWFCIFIWKFFSHFRVTLCEDIPPDSLLLLRNDVKLIRINYGYNSYGSLSTMHQVLEISFIIVIVI